MPQFERYPGEDAAAALKRIAKNKAIKANNPDEIKTKADRLADNLGSTIKNMGGGY